MTEEEMILKVFNYLEKLINVAKPRKLLFMAIDGKTGYGAIRANLIQGIDEWTKCYWASGRVRHQGGGSKLA